MIIIFLIICMILYYYYAERDIRISKEKLRKSETYILRLKAYAALSNLDLSDVYDDRKENS